MQIKIFTPKLLIFLLIIFVIIFDQCSTDTSEFTNAVEEQYDIFPMNIGNIWIYSYTSDSDDFMGESRENGTFTLEIIAIDDQDTIVIYSIDEQIRGELYTFSYATDRWDTTSIEMKENIRVTEINGLLNFSKAPYPFSRFKRCHHWVNKSTIFDGKFSVQEFHGNDATVSYVQIPEVGLFSVREYYSTGNLYMTGQEAELIDYNIVEE